MGRLIFLGGIGLNTENLNGILAQYVQHCKARAAADEGTVWRAVDCFGVNWDIEDSDFPAMFADAMPSRHWTTRPCSPSAACRT